MKRSRLAIAAFVWACLSSGSALAQDQIIDVKPCGFTCKVWRNVSGRSDAALGQAGTDGGMPDGEALSVTAGAEKPNVATIVQHRGEIMEQSPAERAAARRQKRAMDASLANGAKPFDAKEAGK